MDTYNWGFENSVKPTIAIGFCIMNFILLFGWTIWGIGFVCDRRRRSIKSDIEQQEFHLREIQFDHEMRIRNILLEHEHEYSRMLQHASEMQTRQTNAADDEGNL